MSEFFDRDVFKKIIKLSYKNFRKKESLNLTKSQTITNIENEITEVLKNATAKYNS